MPSEGLFLFIFHTILTGTGELFFVVYLFGLVFLGSPDCPGTHSVNGSKVGFELRDP